MEGNSMNKAMTNMCIIMLMSELKIKRLQVFHKDYDRLEKNKKGDLVVVCHDGSSFKLKEIDYTDDIHGWFLQLLQDKKNNAPNECLRSEFEKFIDNTHASIISEFSLGNKKKKYIIQIDGATPQELTFNGNNGHWQYLEYDYPTFAKVTMEHYVIMTNVWLQEPLSSY